MLRACHIAVSVDIDYFGSKRFQVLNRKQFADEPAQIRLFVTGAQVGPQYFPSPVEVPEAGLLRASQDVMQMIGHHGKSQNPHVTFQRERAGTDSETIVLILVKQDFLIRSRGAKMPEGSFRMEQVFQMVFPSGKRNGVSFLSSIHAAKLQDLSCFVSRLIAYYLKNGKNPHFRYAKPNFSER